MESDLDVCPDSGVPWYDEPSIGTVDVQENPNLEEIISDFLGTPIFGMPLILWLVLIVGFPVILYMLYKSGPL